eukprot:6374576-Pyramimonas_sp.AAC.1
MWDAVPRRYIGATRNLTDSSLCSATPSFIIWSFCRLAPRWLLGSMDLSPLQCGWDLDFFVLPRTALDLCHGVWLCNAALCHGVWLCSIASEAASIPPSCVVCQAELLASKRLAD